MRFYADLHIHSKYSRATSRNCDLEHLALWARLKGIAVVATGDFTHPAWFDEIRDKLVPAEPGLFRLRPEVEREVNRRLPIRCRGATRFMLEVEISTIYKKDDKTRKVHHLIYAPDIDTASRFRDRLGKIGNINSDGRPILGLDSRHLLEITLESGPDAYLIPAHIWTPWFAALGSKSGFDSIEACYGDLSEHIFAVETGLSSDPPMNWRLSGLDRFTLVSNSDAHSPPMLGREACVFESDMDYFAMRRALETGSGYGGTVEFFPEEGKYHMDGHRACQIRFEPEETRDHDGLCPVCKKPLTVGVMHRVEILADREEPKPPERAAPFRSLVPLPEIVSELAGVGPKSKTVGNRVSNLVARHGPELGILETLPIEDLGQSSDPLLTEAIERLRQGSVFREGGYDGEYGVIRLFEPGELAARTAVPSLFDHQPEPPIANVDSAPASVMPTTSNLVPPTPAPSASLPDGTAEHEGSEDGATQDESMAHEPLETVQDERPEAIEDVVLDEVGLEPIENDAAQDEIVEPKALEVMPHEAPEDDAVAQRKHNDPSLTDPALPFSPIDAEPPSLLDRLDADQRAAAEILEGPLLIIAGPGTGKTRTLTHRIAHLIDTDVAAPEECLTITFTRRAAEELRERLQELLGAAAQRVPVHTFHGLGLTILREQRSELGLHRGFRIAEDAERMDLAHELFDLSKGAAASLLANFAHARRQRAAKAQAPVLAGPSHSQQQESLDDHVTYLFEQLAQYEAALWERDRVDFDDLLVLPTRLLSERSDLRDAYRERFHWTSIDEYQDIDTLQYQLVRLLVSASANLCAIGDPDQSIYRFRGAEVGFFLRFQDDFPFGHVAHLGRNYRSSPTIVGAALSAIGPSSLVTERKLRAVQETDAEPVIVSEAASERSESETVVHTIERLLGGTSYFSIDSGRVQGGMGSNLSFDDFAVLYRTDAQSGALIEAFDRSGIPYQKRSHARLADRPEVRLLLAALRRGNLPSNRRRQTSVFDRLTREAVRLATLTEPESNSQKPSKADGKSQGATGSLGAAAFRQAVDLVAPLAKRHGDDLHGFLAEIALGAEIDTWDPRAERVSLLTLHAAKGLEFPVVFIVGCEEGLLPLRFGADTTDDEIEEERRLFFVGMTRARQRLYLSYTRRRSWRGALRDRKPSEFLGDLDKTFLELSRDEDTKRVKKTDGPQQLPLV